MNVCLFIKKYFSKFTNVDSKYNFTIFTLSSYHTEQLFGMKY